MIFVPLAFLVAAILAWFLNSLELIPWRRAASAHWTEQARKLFPARVSRSSNLTMIPASFAVMGRLIDPGSPWIAVLAAGFLGTLLGNYPMDRATNPDTRFGEWVRQVACSWMLKFFGWGYYILAALLMPRQLGWSTLAVTAGFFAVFTALQRGLGVSLMRAVGLLKPAPQRLQAIVDTTSAAMNAPVRATWEYTAIEANAIALVVTRDLAFTSRLLAVCPDNELQAICAHELGHLTEGRWAKAGRIAGALILFPLIFVQPAYDWGKGAGLACLAFVVMLIWLGNVKLARAMEKRADQIARESIEEKATYARALERLYRTNLMPAVLKKSTGQIHPNLYDRMEAAGLAPDYPRPQPASTTGWSGVVISTLCVLMAMGLFNWPN